MLGWRTFCEKEAIILLTGRVHTGMENANAITRWYSDGDSASRLRDVREAMGSEPSARRPLISRPALSRQVTSDRPQLVGKSTTEPHPSSSGQARRYPLYGSHPHHYQLGLAMAVRGAHESGFRGREVTCGKGKILTNTANPACDRAPHGLDYGFFPIRQEPRLWLRFTHPHLRYTTLSYNAT